MKKNCNKCKKEFEAKEELDLFCSDECKQEALADLDSDSDECLIVIAMNAYRVSKKNPIAKVLKSFTQKIVPDKKKYDRKKIKKPISIQD
jgi:hypothetical protein